MQTVVETPAFLSDARSLGLPDGERLAIRDLDAANPAAGDVIEGTGGARKVWFAGKGKGKNGGYWSRPTGLEASRDVEEETNRRRTNDRECQTSARFRQGQEKSRL